MAYLAVISSFWGMRCPPWNTRYIFIRCITHTESRNPEFSFALFPSSAVKCWTFAPIRMNISPRDARCRARRHKSFLHHCCVALLRNVIRRLCKKSATVYSTPRVATNGQCYTVSRMDTVTGKLWVEKRAATQDPSPCRNISPTVCRLTRFKISYAVYPRNSATNLCHSKHPRRFIHAMTAVSNIVTCVWPSEALSTAKKYVEQYLIQYMCINTYIQTI